MDPYSAVYNVQGCSIYYPPSIAENTELMEGIINIGDGDVGVTVVKLFLTGRDMRTAEW